MMFRSTEAAPQRASAVCRSGRRVNLRWSERGPAAVRSHLSWGPTKITTLASPPHVAIEPAGKGQVKPAPGEASPSPNRTKESTSLVRAGTFDVHRPASFLPSHVEQPRAKRELWMTMNWTTNAMVRYNMDWGMTTFKCIKAH